MHVSHGFVRLERSDATNGIALCRVSLFFAMPIRKGLSQKARKGTTKRAFLFLCVFVPLWFRAFMLFATAGKKHYTRALS